MKRRFFACLCFAGLALGVQGGEPGGLLDEGDLAFLRQLTVDVLEDSKIAPGQSVVPEFGPNRTGGTLVRPGGRDCYPAFWIRDYALSLDCGLISEADQLHMLRLTAATQCDQTWITNGGSMVPLGAIADHIRIDDSLPIYFPGTYSYEDQGTEQWGIMPPYSDQFFFINMAHHYVKSSGRKKVLHEVIAGVPLIERLERAFGVPPARQETGLVYTDEWFRGVDFGFRDAQIITGDLCIASVFKYRAARELAELFGVLRDDYRSALYDGIAEQIKAAIPATFADRGGMLCASTGRSGQTDVWATALAVYYGILDGADKEKACRSLASAYRGGKLAYRGNIRHVPTTDDYDERTAWEMSMTPKDTYQNGAYWGTPTGWVCHAIAQVDPEAARRLAREFVEDLRENDYRKGEKYGAPWECFHPNGHQQNPVYLTTVTCPLAVFERVKK